MSIKFGDDMTVGKKKLWQESPYFLLTLVQMIMMNCDL